MHRRQSEKMSESGSGPVDGVELGHEGPSFTSISPTCGPNFRMDSNEADEYKEEKREKHFSSRNLKRVDERDLCQVSIGITHQSPRRVVKSK